VLAIATASGDVTTIRELMDAGATAKDGKVL